MKDASIQSALAKIMIIGVVAAAFVMVAGLAIYLPGNADRPEGDRVFTGEPSYLTHPLAMAERAMAVGRPGETSALIQLGVLLLLLNPVVRVVFALAGFALQKDWLYVWSSLAVLTALAASFHW